MLAFGTLPGEVLKDDEGVQTMRILGRNMAWLMNAIEKKQNRERHSRERKQDTI